MRSETFSYTTGDRDTVLDITRDCAAFVADEADGLLHVFVPHATAGVAIIETGSGSDDDLLAQLDWVVGSVHTSFGMAESEMTKRIVAACEHPWIDAIGHPTGRKIERRQAYAVDMNAVIDAAARTGTMLEINAAPDRRDLNDVHARHAAQVGVKILIDSDAHGVRELALARWGIATARRAWLTADDVANTRPWAEFAQMRKRAKAAR